MLVTSEGTPETFAGLRRQAARCRLCHLIEMLVRRLAQETNLPAVASAPFADEKMKLQAEPAEEGLRLVDRSRLESAHLLAGRQ